ncbi:alpha/beta hydrolase [Rhodoligotrophos defluvii]|uniref:alpha/beta hydrolase n=1 Tax=Rhodoligotrophos defluvii TaxID=2561934 RepID=UPI001EF07E65|nr:alpha/beta hydrolase [Rhodoligotrophos defluvii]
MNPGYRTLLDAEVWRFIERINAFYPPDALDLPIERNREIYRRMSAAFHAGRPAGITAQDSFIDASDRRIPIRTYRSIGNEASALVLYFHGGGFVLGDLDTHDDICAELCAGTGHVVISVDYRLAPEHAGTAAFDDAMAAFAWAATAYTLPVVLVGESAGGTLAASVAHHTRGHARSPAGQVLVYPSLGGDKTRGSYVDHRDAPLLSVTDLERYEAMRAGGADISRDVRFTPLADPDFTGLPPTVIFTAECDPLCCDGATYRDRLTAAGGLAWSHEEKGLPHGFLRARHMSVKARESFKRLTAAVKALGSDGL